MVIEFQPGVLKHIVDVHVDSELVGYWYRNDKTFIESSSFDETRRELSILKNVNLGEVAQFLVDCRDGYEEHLQPCSYDASRGFICNCDQRNHVGTETEFGSHYCDVCEEDTGSDDDHGICKHYEAYCESCESDQVHYPTGNCEQCTQPSK